MARARRRVKDRPDWADGAALVVKCVTVVTPMPPSQSIPRDFLGIEVQECASISRCSGGSWLTILAEPSFEADSLPGYILAALSVRDSNSGHARPHFFLLIPQATVTRLLTLLPCARFAKQLLGY